MYLRDYAGPDGTLPIDFDELVRESFGDVLGTPARMTPRLAQREVALAGLALLAVAVVASRSPHRPARRRRTAPQPEGSYVALAGSSGPAAFGRRTACGGVIRADTIGVAHPTLPCGARIFITYHGKTVLTQVVDRGPYVPGPPVRSDRRARAPARPARRADDPLVVRPFGADPSRDKPRLLSAGVLDVRSCAAYPCRTNTM